MNDLLYFGMYDTTWLTIEQQYLLNLGRVKSFVQYAFAYHTSGTG
ncbi:hypothetical protein [Mucilaginibacter galii]|nr:hypothetical protein [Mucilaginibacter galii]